MGVYLGWGGLKEEYVIYDSRFVDNNDGRTEYQLNFGEVPIDAFWSIIVYDNNGYIYEQGNNTLNNFLAQPKVEYKFAKFLVKTSGVKTCTSGASTTYATTFDVGCDQAGAAAQYGASEGNWR